MTTIEKLSDGLISERAKTGAPDAPTQEAVGFFPSPDGSPVAIDKPEVGAGSAGWYPDPTARHDLRFFDGKHWTEQRTRILPIEPVRRRVSPPQVGS